ncbi:MAG: translocase FtsK protein [Microgenomates group bacterium GW2011_GWC1_44_37]|uniref:Translocase FtsK protein n=1 Tax=Candidatus Collierbacteria bacterium GW2011_GWB2_44_22 TaxID=1618387 RepID=A0A0G1K7T3_9BACT|nr:MAG: translocase FtsK protein [Candidatus Collierbacteria bacterium GW2011_GWA2_44_13]KKT49925.1 MAG: translocase FtsK protein [Candidatus Collierbacteria bacterium GW2011_GWB1_44_197]KKT52372.1 MAG: translocase FtsK protein [Candidatus Collierbacteria bacterium GW2011_GWB2_44_22]KKT62824.1 MAG: translocase FtsK protein [Candidatus Collierbacteria bacterium GW2011_GWD1_44_27]KKT64739.1 MAG: translocase FtsK protein [Candidatus Collierbacteria bacterium GW2011_GWC2_44_30]KKT69274.1 MAG: tran
MARKKGRRSKPYKLNLKKDTTNSIIAILLMGIGGLIAISFSQQGDVLLKINEIGRQLLGWPLFFLPFIFITGGLIVTHVKLPVASTHVLLGSVITMISLNGLFGAGSIGVGLKESVVSLISLPGAMLFYFIGVVIGLFILFETSIEDLLVIVQKLFGGISGTLGKIKSLPIKGGSPVFLNKSNTVKITGGDESKAIIPGLPAISTPVKISSKDHVINRSIQTAVEVKKLPDGAATGVWHFPPINLLSDQKIGKADRGDIKKNIETIQNTLGSFAIQAKVTEVHQGPAVTQYALTITAGTKLSKISALQSDLALALAAPQGQIRIEAPIPGRDLVGIEIPNRSLEFVTLREMLTDKAMQESRSKTSFSLGLDVSGQSVVADINKMPHLLIAGTTGSGKSVLINAIISSILFRATPEEVKFIMVDPKRVELTPYNDIPHLLTPVITDVSKVVNALKWATAEMDRRYRLFEEMSVKNIAGYNELSGFQAMPYIIIIVDEMADLMMSKNANEVEDCIVRIAQMARAVGIHLVLATQRPSVNVLTGLIKANIPARIAFQVTSMIDSRVIIDTPGAEKLLGKGDMLYIPPDTAKPKRIQGAFVSDKEIKNLIDFIRSSGVTAQLDETITKDKGGKSTLSSSGLNLGPVDEKFEEAAHLCIAEGKGSASLLQRRLEIGYARAARILDQLEQAGVLAHAEGNKPREVVVGSLSEVFSEGDENS